ncbi:MAG TPA: PorP/SprF family type IX secretion system membrane protein, partial [Cytophagaceae bacterium]
MLRFYFTILIAAISGLAGYAQQMPQISNFMHNQLVYNPASAGMHPTQLNANLVTRFQWSSVTGAPITNMFWADYRFEGKNMAIGININRDQLGANKMTDLLANYSYYIPLSHKWKLSMGLRAGTSSRQFDINNLERIWDDNDPIVAQAGFNYFEPVIGTGFQLSSRNTYIGISAPNLLNQDKYNIYNNKNKGFLSKSRDYMLLGGHVIKLNDSYSLQPNLRVLYYPG